MTSTAAQPPTQPGPVPGRDAQAQAELAGYLEAMEAEDAPVLGYLVLYSVFDGPVTRDDLEHWFAEFGRSARSTPSRRSPARPGSG